MKTKIKIIGEDSSDAVSVTAVLKSKGYIDRQQFKKNKAAVENAIHEMLTKFYNASEIRFK